MAGNSRRRVTTLGLCGTASRDPFEDDFGVQLE